MSRADAEIVMARRALDELKDLHARKIIEDELLWRELSDRYGDYFEGGMGAESISQLIDAHRPRRGGDEAPRQ